ncbi:hypothetical protein [Pseudooceanicola sp. 200-1SW]|uniref:hypothetical protein n=1 Tax=Pseudooceanicola sp. 200-1SW TaxID=3425949 RepID=UPI003D7F9D54
MKTLLVTTFLTLTLSAPLQASCAWKDQQASACAKGTTWNAESQSCEALVTG